MKTLDDVIFIDNLPTIDLHGYDSQTARVAINDFIKDNIKMKNEVIAIVHGIGSGVLRKTTNETLKNNIHILEYKSYYYNNGCTLALLDIELCNNVQKIQKKQKNC